MTCPTCGCDGIHACIGHKLEEITEEGRAQLARLMHELAELGLSQEDLTGDVTKILHDNIDSLNEK